MSVQELKHAAKLQEWSTRVAECRSSGISVKAWCAEQRIALKTYYNWEKEILRRQHSSMCFPYLLRLDNSCGSIQRPRRAVR